MSSPSPLIPQGTFQAQASKGASNVRIAVATIVAIHLVFFGGLLLQGCKRDNKTAATGADTNAATNLSLPPIDSASLYSTSSAAVAEVSNTAAAPLPGAGVSNASGNGFAETPITPPGAAQDLWKSSNNLAAPTTATAEAGTGATKEYTVVRGDSFGRIAKRNGTTVSAIEKANPNIDPRKIRPGMKLNIPVAAAETASPAGTTANAGTPGATGESSSAPAQGATYTVKAGDTLTKIARTHGVTVGQIRSANNLKTARINVGQKLTIPAPNSEGTAPEAKKTNATKHASLRKHHAARQSAPATL